MITINPPSPNDTRSVIADWIELHTLVNPNGVSIQSQLLNILDFLEDEAAEPKSVDPETQEPLDEAILEGSRQQLIESTIEELEYRHSILNDSYPFEVNAKRKRLRWIEENPITHPGKVVYLFCLFASAIRERKLQPLDQVTEIEKHIANVFQVCACLAAGGYIGGEVSSFGFPRASGDGFLVALRKTYERFGTGQVRDADDIPRGLPTALKDGGIDVIAWRDHPDMMPGKIYLLGQCASGKNWREKSVVEYIEPLHGMWFTSWPAKHSSPAMFIPFPLHHEIGEQSTEEFLSVVKTRFWSKEMRFGIIFDRFRVTHFANACMQFADDDRVLVDGADQFDRVKEWVQETFQIAGVEAWT